MLVTVRHRTVLVAATLAAASGLALIAAPVATADPAPPGGSVIPVAPVRVVDTGSGGPGITTGLVRPGDAVPSPIENVAAVLVNVTVVDAETAGYIRIGEGTGTSNGNFVAHAPSATLALVPLVHSGTDQNGFRFVTSTPVHRVIVDVQGYVTTPDGATASSFTPLAPKRIADTRSASGLVPFTANKVQILDVRTRGTVPSNATAVIANLTLVKPTASTYLTAWSGEGARPTVSSVNAGAGTTVANRTVLPLDPSGKISLYNFAGRTDVLVDVVGYLSPDSAGSYYVPAASATRLTDHSGERITLTPTNPGGSEVTTTAVWTTLAAAATTPGYLVAGPTVTLPSTTSDLNLQAGRAVANSGPVMLTSTGSFSVASAPSSRFVVDLDGWFQKAAA